MCILQDLSGDGDGNISMAADTEAPLFSCHHHTSQIELYTHVLADHIIYHLGWTASQSWHNCNVNFSHSLQSNGWNSQSLLPARSSKFQKGKGLRKVLILLNSTLYVYSTLLDAHIHCKTGCASGRKKWETCHVICQCQSRIADLRPKIREIFGLTSRGASEGLL